MNPRELTQTKAARYVGVEVRTFKAWAAKWGIPHRWKNHIGRGGHKVYRVEDIDRALERQRVRSILYAQFRPDEVA